mmetsp:Transcript_22269/g.39214  ORF Transcript_22269/g.39214 Transcript_22269/m.39214 type:complete len:210 (+) Transcript_22269:54-683(+)
MVQAMPGICRQPVTGDPARKRRPPQLNTFDLEAPARVANRGQPSPPSSCSSGSSSYSRVVSGRSPGAAACAQHASLRNRRSPLATDRFCSDTCSESGRSSAAGSEATELFLSCQSPHVRFDDALTTIYPISPCTPACGGTCSSESLIMRKVWPPPPPPVQLTPRPPAALPTGRAFVARQLLPAAKTSARLALTVPIDSGGHVTAVTSIH